MHSPWMCSKKIRRSSVIGRLRRGPDTQWVLNEYELGPLFRIGVGAESLIILNTRVTSFLNTDTELPPISGSRWHWLLDLLSTRDLQAVCQKDPSLSRMHEVQKHSKHAGASYYPSVPKPLDFNV